MQDLSHKATAYVLGVISIGTAIAGYLLYNWEGGQLTEIALLGSLAALSLIFKVIGSTDRSHYNLSFLFYGFALIFMGIEATILVVLIANTVDWLWNRYPKWYIQPFNVATYIIAILLADVAYTLVMSSGSFFSFAGVLSIILAASIFVLVNHLLVGLVIWLARRQNFKQSGVFNFLPLMIDFTMFAMGATVAWIWAVSPYGMLLILIPLYLIYSTLRLPALERKTEIDPKTDVFNARYFNDALEAELKRAHLFKRPLSVIMADMDLLREVNNTYGHLAGDIALKGVAQILKEEVRHYDIVSRFGGEEFAIVLPETDADEAVAVSEWVRQAIEAASFHVSTSIKPISVTMSFGVASLNGSTLSTQELIHHADLALYQAKENGRNCTYIFGQGQAQCEQAESAVSERSSTPVIVEAAANGGAAEAQAKAAAVAEAIQTDAPTDERVAVTRSGRWVNLYVTVVAGTALLLSLFMAVFYPAGMTDWVGIFLFALVAFTAEIASLEIYVNKTTVSTSVTVLVAGTLLFGPPAAVVLGLSAALGAQFKNRSHLSRLVFNSGNFVIGNIIILCLTAITSQIVALPPVTLHIVDSFVGIMLVYLATTVMVSGVLSAKTGQNLRQIWETQYRWLSPYYLAMGAVVFVLLYTYELTGILGIIVVFIPLLLLRFSQKKYLDHTRTIVMELQNKNQELFDYASEITLLNEEMMLTLAHSIDLRDPYVMEHSRHVARYAVLIGAEMGLSDAQQEDIRKAALLHDIGKLGIPESILFKPDRLTAQEYLEVKRHTEIGAELLEGCHSLHAIIPYVLHHHEHFDGNGYPGSLAGTEIPIEARIVGLADAVEAMASDRPYSPAKPVNQILAEIDVQAGKQFDPEVCAAFVRVVNREGRSVIVNSARTIVGADYGDKYESYFEHNVGLRNGNQSLEMVS